MDPAQDLLIRHKLDVVAFHRMTEAGILHEDDRVELIGGELIDMAPIGQGHAAAVNGLNEAMVLACAGRALVSTQNPLRLDAANEPQPDLAVLRPRADRYRTGEPAGPADALLVVEVADSSLRFDQHVKLPLYARANMAEVWIVDLRERTLRVHRAPHGDGTDREVTTYGPGDTVGLALAPDIRIALDLVFGSRGE